MVKKTKDPEYYVLVKKSLIRTWLVVTAILTLGVLASFQYANFVDRRSNQQWCRIVVLFDSTDRASPPTSKYAEQIAGEFDYLRQRFKCK